MEFRLGLQCESPQTGDIEINFFDEISEYEFNKLSAALAKLEELGAVRRLNEFVLLNEKDLNNYLNNAVKELLTMSQSPAAERGDEMRDVHININRLVLNYLSSTRTFIDHTTTFLVRKLGEDSKDIGQFKAMLSNCYDQSFAYRFLSKLRNYAQHVDIPISNVKFSISYNDDRKEMQGELTVGFSPDHLLEKFQKWGTVKKDLLKMESYFPLMPLISELTFYVALIERNIELIFKDELLEATNYIYGKLDKLPDKIGNLFVGYDFDDNKDGSLASFSQKFIPMETLDAVAKILAK